VDSTLAAEIAILLALLALWIVVLRDAWRAWQPARLLLAGRYPEARTAALRLERSWLRLFRGVRISARYAIGCALHLEGDLEGSLAALAPLHTERLRGNMRYAVCSIEAANLVLLDRDHARAGGLLEEAAAIQRPPEDVLLAALAKLGQGAPADAEGLFVAAGTRRGGARLRMGNVVLMENGRQQEAIFHALRGLYLVKVGRLTDAQRELEIAARSPVPNVYVERARAMLQASDVEPSDPRSSLAPQIVGSDEPG
jgi:hypothetical protein